MNSKGNLKKLFLWIGFLAIFLIPALWYKGPELILGGDLTFPLDPAHYLDSIFHIWRRVALGSNSAISLTTTPFYAPMALFDTLGLSLKLVEQLHFGLWLALPAISIFYLSGVLFKNHPYKLAGQLTAVIVYLFNTYEVVWADSARMAVWVGLPAMFAFFVQGLADQKQWWRWSIGIAIVSVVTSTAAANPPMFLMFAALFVFWLIFHLFTTPTDRTLTGLKRIAFFLITTFLLALAINLFWIIPYGSVLLNDYRGALTSGLGGIQFTDWLGPLSTNTSLLNVMRLQGAWDWYAGWQGEPYVPAAFPYQHNPFYLAWSVIVPLIAFAALLCKPKNIDRRLIYFLAIISLLGLIMGAGSHEPTGKIYKWLLERIQFLSIYRSPWYKFTTWTVFGYSLLSAISLMVACQWLSTKKRVLPPILVGLIIAATLVYSSGLVLGKVFPRKEERIRLHSAHVTFPDYFFKAADWINNQGGDFRILQLPAQEAFNYRWGLGTLMDMTIFTFKQPTIWWPEQTGSGPAKPGSEAMTKQAYDRLYAGLSEKMGRLYGLLNIRYLLQKDDIDYAFYGGLDSPEYIRSKMKQQDFTLAHEEGPWQFYEIKSADQRPLLFPTNRYYQTGKTEKELVSTVLSPLFQSTDSYGNRVDQTLPASIPNGSALRPNLEKMTVAGNVMTAPIQVPTAGRYFLSFEQIEPVDIQLDGQPISAQGEIDLAAGDHDLRMTVRSGLPNLINNPSFEDGIWEQPIDSTQSQPGHKDFSASIIADGANGQAMRIESKSHTAAVRRAFNDFESNRQYFLSFSYRSSAGQPPRFGIWQQKAFVLDPAVELDRSTDWQTYKTLVQTRPSATEAHLFLYADPTEANIPTVADYDEVQVIKLPKFLDTLTLASKLEPAAGMPTTTFVRRSSTAYDITVQNAQSPYILNFLEQFDAGWQLSATDRQPLTANHIQVFGYANGWTIDRTGSYSLRLDFQPQRTFQSALFVSLLSLIGSAYLLLTSQKPKQKRKI
jgi:hypothetical protein